MYGKTLMVESQKKLGFRLLTHINGGSVYHSMVDDPKSLIFIEHERVNCVSDHQERLATAERSSGASRC